LTLKPDLVIIQGHPEKMQRFCARQGIELLAVRVDNWDSITNTIQLLGNRVGRASDAARVRSTMTAQLARRRAQQAAAEVPAFVCLGRAPGAVSACTTAAHGSFVDEMLRVAGGSNVCADVLGSYPTVAAEVLSARKPRVIFDVQPEAALAAEDLQAIALEWRKIVPGADVVVITNQGALIPGPRIIGLAEAFGRGINAAGNAHDR
jgi:iron complex transport system substrate-binding protein